MSLTPASMFCTMLETQYNALIALIDEAVVLPIFALTQLKSNLSRVFSILYNAIEATIAVLQAQLISILQLDLIDQTASNLAFCNTAWLCQPLKNLLFDRDLLFFLTDDQYEAVQTTYEEFEKYICKTSFIDLIGSWTSDSLDIISRKIQELRDQLLGAIGIDEIIDKYQQALEDSGLFDLLEQLDLYAECAFGICNYYVTESNKMEDIETKLQIEKKGSSWVVSISDAFQEVYDLDASLTQQLDDLDQQIANFRNDGTRDARGVSPDQIMS